MSQDKHRPGTSSELTGTMSKMSEFLVPLGGRRGGRGGGGDEINKEERNDRKREEGKGGSRME